MRLAFLSDIHEDFESLRRMLRKAQRKGYDQLICLGDISGFSVPYHTYESKSYARSCLDLIRKNCDYILPGNHDMHAARRLPRHSAVFEFPENWYELPVQKQTVLSGGDIWLHDDELETDYTAQDREFLRSLPEFVVLPAENYNILLSHYVHPNLAGFKKGFYSHEQEFGSHFEFMSSHDCVLGFTGHAHPRGFNLVRPGRFRSYGYRKLRIPDLPAIITVPPVTRHKDRRGFSIFDTERLVLKAYR